jgi:L-threonylcarbamoyladenylate synthase
LIFDAVSKLPSILTANTGKVGIRLPRNEWTRRLIQTAGCALTATSANKNGEKNTRTAQEVLHIFGKDIDLIIDPGPAPGGKVSTLLDTTISPPTLLRLGAITQQEIDSCIKNEHTLVS